MDEAALRRMVEVSIQLKTSFFEAEGARVLDAGRTMSEALRAGHKILAFGNGGSAADAQHFAAELVNRYVSDRPALAALALTTDSSILTSVGNDSHYKFVFSRQIEALGSKGDVALAISTSGNSENVLEGAAACRKRGVRSIGLLGRDGGKVKDAVDFALVVPHGETARIQEVHAMIVHVLCEVIDDELFPRRT